MRKRTTTYFKEILGIFLGLSFLLTLTANAQDCGCDHVVEVGTTYLDGSRLGVKPGDVVCLKAGRRTNLFIKNFVGSSSNYITIKNCGGQVVLGGSTINNGITAQNSRYFRITGTGVAGMKYGIKIDKTKSGSQGVAIAEFSSDVEIDHLEIAGAGFAGIMAKTDPKCDGSADRGRFTMYNVKIHDNYIYDAGGEGIYLGNSFYNGTTVYCNTTKYPHEIKGVRVYNNIVKNTGWEAIQVGAATHDVEVYDNEIFNYGMANRDSQNNGIQLGLGTTGKCYNNYIENGYGTGIVIQGIGNNLVYNNVIIGAGYPAFNVNVRPTPLSTDVVSRGFLGGVHIINNTIVDTKNSGAINEYVNDAKNNTFQNNLIVSGSSNWKQLKTYTSWVVEKNTVLRSASEAKFVNPSGKDYRIKEGSPAIDAGKDVSGMGINLDWDRQSRKVGATTDTGIDEFASATTTTVANAAPTVNAGSDQSIQLPTNSVSLSGTASDSDGQIASYLWTKVNGPNATLTGANTNRLQLSNLTEGTYTFKLTVKDDKGAAASNDVIVNVKAALVEETPAEETPVEEVEEPAPTPVTEGNNILPTIIGRGDQTVTLPKNYAYLSCGGKDADGFITSYKWTKVSGPAASLSGENVANLKVSNLVAGTYVFRITATDNNGAQAYDDVTVKVIGDGNTAEVVEEVNETPVQSPTTDGNIAPTVEGRGPATITLPTNSAWLGCGGKDADGFIASYKWTKVSGPAASLSGENVANLKVSNLVAGTYVFRITATDNNGAQAYDDVAVKVIGDGNIAETVEEVTETVVEEVIEPVTTETSNLAPLVKASNDKTLTLPENSSLVTCAGKDEDGFITSYQWTKLSGPGVSLSGAGSANLNLSNMVAGTYVFRVKVKDNGGAEAYDDVKVIVNPAETTSPTVSSPQTESGKAIYRINAGGTSNLSASPIQWDMDTKENPSRYLSTSSSNNTAGSNTWRGTNNTNAPNAVFGPIRFDFSWGGAMKYSLPVASGTYEVRLYFAETPYSGGVKAAGARVFDVKVEGQTKVSNLDIYKEAGMNALQKTVTITVTDGKLDIDFVRKVGNPQVNGIEILTASDNNSNTMSAPTASKDNLMAMEVIEESNEITVYPNPVVDRLNIRFGKELSSDATIQLINLNGVNLLTETISNSKGTTEASLDISHINAPGGIYLLKVQTAEDEQVIKIMKY